MGAGYLEIKDLWFVLQLLVKQAGGVLNKFGEGAIHLSEGLLILTLNHDLRLRLQSFEAEFLYAFNAKVLTFSHLNTNTSRAALRVRNAIDVTVAASVL